MDEIVSEIKINHVYKSNDKDSIIVLCTNNNTPFVNSRGENIPLFTGTVLMSANTKAWPIGKVSTNWNPIHKWIDMGNINDFNKDDNT